MSVTVHEHNGQRFVLESDYNSTVQGMTERITRLSTQKNEAETKAQNIQTQMDDMQGRLGLVDTLQQQNQELQSKLEQSNTRYDRHTTLSQLGVNDDSVRQAFEMIYNQAGDDKPAFGDWVNNLKAKPEEAPLLLRSYLQGQPNTNQQQPNNQPHNQPSQQPNTNGQHQPQNPFAPNQQQQQPPQHQAPPSNYAVVGSQNQMTKNQILDRASTDMNFLKENQGLVHHLINPKRYPMPKAE